MYSQAKCNYQLRVERARGRLLHLGRQEVGEALGREAVNVVDRVSLSRQRVDEHSSARRDGRLGDFKQRACVQTSG